MTGSYVPLARKWRPRTFADVVGQEEIVRALVNAVTQDRLAHAYLFSGPRGVGKTTSARLLAAAINCHASDRPTPSPCGTCASCTEVLEGRSIDALEIDGATHGKVDQARDLIEVVAFAPVRDRRKVFIIDEVHAISAAAFQALLKTLEEPPSHAVFILATTERHKIPATILSRCQRFDFRRLTDGEVAERLADIARREGFSVGDEPGPEGGPRVERAALSMLGAAATGSLRDGLSLFDQVAARAGGPVTAADVAALLGAPDRTALVALLTSLLEGDRAAVLAGCARLESAGADPRSTLHDLTALVRGAVRMAADPAAGPPAGLSEEGAARVTELARLTPYPTLLRLLTLTAEGDGTLRRSDVPALAFEVLLLRLAELPRLVPIEEILSGRLPLPPAAASAPAANGLPAAPAPVPPPPPPEAVSPRKAEPAHPRPAKAEPAPRRAAPEPEAPRFVGLTPLAVEPDPEPVADPAGAFREAVEKRQGQLAAALEDASVRVSGRTVRIVLDPPNPVLEKRLAEGPIRKFLVEAAVAVFGKTAEVVVESGEPDGGDLTQAAATADPRALEKEHLKRRVTGDERVKKILDLFGGEIADVRRDEGGS
ncbi:MAG: DNA polymerase III subunit gamma/tau [Acidobacteria bacterium]|nr:MAG: DNA polymerase III subunit gamma/tau [Acidobacteriota bacterium]